MTSSGHTKSAVMAAMLVAAGLLTAYFHGTLGSSVLFTHLFYIPIILGALWWGRRGISVALFLSLFLVASHWLYTKELFNVDDLFRAVLFLVVSVLVIAIRQKILSTEAALQQQIIAHEKARAELDRYQVQLKELVRERTEALIAANRKLHEEIAEREKINTSLRESENQYRLLFENANEAIFIAQGEQIRFHNPGLTALTGYSNEQFTDGTFLSLVHPEDRKLVTNRYQQRLAGEPVPASYPFRIRAADGSTLWVEINSVLIQWQGQMATLNFLRDISARKKLEATIRQIQKMDAIGVLAGGIAHKFNNALSGITGNTDLLKYSLPDNPAVKRYSEAVFRSVHEMVRLTQQLVAYARGGKYQPEKQSLNALIDEVVSQMPADDEKQIHIETVFAADTLQVEADRLQLRTVLLAVINNAAEAITKAGHIRIETFSAQMDETAADAFTGLIPGWYAALSITDNGKGMPESVRARVFEPFFSTKFIGRGLGMAAAYGIIKNHGGYIFIDSEPGHGTVVNILLPAYP
jgi:PAS domain S-box-containing protein